MSVWYLIFLCGVLTFLIRFIPLSGLIKFKGSELYLKVINLIPIVVLTPIIVQALFFDRNDNLFLGSNGSVTNQNSGGAGNATPITLYPNSTMSADAEL